MAIMKPVTRDVAMHHRGTFYHAHLTNRDGSPVRCRTNGACRTWQTRPDDFRLPVKWGLRTYFYITPGNAGEWRVTDEDWERVQAAVRRIALCERLRVKRDIPDPVLRDLAADRGLDVNSEWNIKGEEN